MYTLNNNQLWSRNIYDHELMILSMVLTNKHESNQNIFLDLHALRWKGSLFCFAKWQTSQIFIKKEIYFW